MIEKGRRRLLQQAYQLGYRRALTRMRGELDDLAREMKQRWEDEVADLKGVIDGIASDYENAKAVAKAMAERDPEMRLH